MIFMSFGDDWSNNDFLEELHSIMSEGDFTDVNECLRIEDSILNNTLSDEDKKRIIYQNI